MDLSNADITSEIINDIIQKACDSENDETNNNVASTDEIILQACDQFDGKESYDDGMESCLKEESVNFSKMIIESDSGEIESSTIDNNENFMTSEISVNAVNVPPKENNASSTYYSDKLLSSKGFSKKNYENVREIVNLPLVCIASQFTECKILCFGFPSQMMENEFIPLFERFGGPVYKFTKIVDRNMVFVTYTTTKGAMEAVRALDGRVFRGHKISAVEYLSEGRLFVKSIPTSMTKGEIFRSISAITNTLVKVSLYNDQYDEKKSRGFCYLHYPDRAHAQNAKKILESKIIFGKRLTIEWPNKRINRSDNHTLYISNLRRDKHPDDLRKLFSVFGKVTNVQIYGNFGIVRFDESDDANCAAREIDKSLLGNENVEISMHHIGEKIIPKTLPYAADRTTKEIVKKTVPEFLPSSTLYVKNLHSYLSASVLRKYFSIYGEVNDIDKDGNFASVRFRYAENAKKAAREINRHQLGHNVEISFQNPNEEKITDTLYITNLPPFVSTVVLRKTFSAHGNVMDIDKDGKDATVRFVNVENAERAYNEIDKKSLGKDVKISLKKMVDKNL